MNQILQHSKALLWGIAIAFVIYIAFINTGQAQAAEDTESTEPSMEQTFASLQESLAVLTEAVKRSSQVSDSQRIMLFSQLIQVSRAILGIQVSGIEAGVREALTDEELVDGVQTLAEAGLYRVIATIEPDTFRAEVVLYFTPGDLDETNVRTLFARNYSTKRYTYQLDRTGLGNESFERQMIAAQRQVATRLAVDENIDPVPLGGIVFISARNPRRDDDEPIEQNSRVANRLVDDFGTRSVVTRVLVDTGEEEARLTFFSDQDERIRLTLTKNFTYRREGDEQRIDTSIPPTYTFTAEHFIQSGLTSTCEEDEVSTCEIPPITTFSIDDLTVADVLRELDALFEESPFTESFVNADQRMLSFLSNNPGYYNYDLERGSDEIINGCVDRGDELIFNEYILQILSGLRAQFILTGNLFQYRAPNVGVEGDWNVGCRQTKKFF